MVSFIVNGKRHRSGLLPETWGELLDRLEKGESVTRQVVTAARLGGVAIPTFRDTVSLSRRIADVGRIEVEMSTVSELLHQSARTAHESIGQILDAVARIAVLWREHEIETADREWSAVVSSLRMLTRITAMLVVTGGTAAACRTHLDALIVRVCGLLDEVVECQAQRRWRGVARVLDVQLAPALHEWSSILQTLDRQHDERDPKVSPIPMKRERLRVLEVAL